MRALLLIALTATLHAQGEGPSPGNVLLVVLDDVGVDRVRAYGEHPLAASTPTLDQLAAEGVRFTRCWANPLCSPTRATILTGRYGMRTGIGHVIGNLYGTTGLDLGEWTLPEVIRRGTDGAYRTACLGKWHLVGPDQGLAHAEDSGFELFAGTLGNLGDADDPEAYYHWSKVVNGQLVTVDRYATRDTADDLLRTIDQLGDDPWFIWTAFHAAHLPYHAPPPDLTDYPLAGDPADSPALHHKAMVQAMDAELGRVLAEMDPEVLARTTVIVIADNGTQGPASEAPTHPMHGKGTLFEGGIRVPLIVWGAGVGQAGVCDALVNASDLFATTLDLVGVDSALVLPAQVQLDSVSLTPYLAQPSAPSLREFVYSEAFKPNNVPRPELTKLRRALRDERYKLVRNELDQVDRLYDLWLDPGEVRDLLALPHLSLHQRQAWLKLDRHLRALVGE